MSITAPAYYAVVAIAVIGCLVSALGICAAKKKNKCCLMIYGGLGSVAALVFLIIGAILFMVGSNFDKVLTTTCTNSAKLDSGISFVDKNAAIAKGVDMIQDYVDQFDQNTGRLSATFMCSRYCPCTAATLVARKDCAAQQLWSRINSLGGCKVTAPANSSSGSNSTTRTFTGFYVSTNAVSGAKVASTFE